MLISSFLPFTGGQGPEQKHFGLILRQRGRVPLGRLLCINSILLVSKSNGKQMLKYQIQHGVRIDFPVTDTNVGMGLGSLSDYNEHESLISPA